MAGLSGSVTSIPTWEYVQQVVARNIGKSETAIGVAEAHINAISDAYVGIQEGDWNVDTEVGTDVTLNWTGLTQGGSAIEPDQLTDLPDSVEVRNSTVQVIDAGVAPTWNVDAPSAPSNLPGATLPTVATLPAVSAINVSVPAVTVAAANHGFTATGSPGWALDLGGTPGAVADDAISPIDVLGTVPAIDADATAIDVAAANRPDVPIKPQLWDVDLSGTPEALAAPVLSAVAQLNALPLIDVVTPTMDVALLEGEFVFAETSYVERVSTEIEANIKTALGGQLGLPQGYWDALWAEVSNDLARLQVGELRNARNRGAATHWGLPTEAVLAASRAIQDEGARKLQAARLEQAKQHAVMAREDYWQAITQGITYEKMWIDQSDKVNQRALAAAEHAIAMSIQVHNSNITQFNARLATAQLAGTIDEMKVKRLLSKHSQELQSNAMEISQDKALIERWLGEWQGFDTEHKLEIAEVSERVKAWNTEIGARVSVAGLELDTTKTNVGRYQAILEKDKLDASIDNMDVQRALGSYGAKLDRSKTEIAADKAVLDRWLGKWEGYKTEKTLGVTSLAEQTKAWGIEMDSAAKEGTLNLDEVKTNLARHQASLDSAKLELETDVATVKRTLESHSANIQTAQAQNDRDKQLLARWLGAWQGYKMDYDSQIAATNGETDYWAAKVDGQAKLSSIATAEDKLSIDNYMAQVSKVDTVAKATSQLLNARVSKQQADDSGLNQAYQNANMVNTSNLDVARLSQAAQETRAKLDIAQKEWLGGQGNTLLNNMAQLSVGLAQSLITVSDVNLGSSVSVGDSYSESASRNAPKVW